MTRFAIRTPAGRLEAIADDEVDALGQAMDADLLHDGDEGNLEQLPDPEVEPYEPEGPG